MFAFQKSVNDAILLVKSQKKEMPFSTTSVSPHVLATGTERIPGQLLSLAGVVSPPRPEAFVCYSHAFQCKTHYMLLYSMNTSCMNAMNMGRNKK